jgi:hypothetical protein
MLKKLVKFAVVSFIFALPFIVLYPVVPILAYGYVIFFLAPTLLLMFKNWAIRVARNCGNLNKKEKRIKKEVELKEYKSLKEVYKNEREQYYLITRDLFRDSMKNGLLSRQDILKIKEMLNEFIGEEYLKDYKNYTHKMKDKNGNEKIVHGFDGDCHEIYVKMKSFHILPQEWREMNKFIRDCIEGKVSKEKQVENVVVEN